MERWNEYNDNQLRPSMWIDGAVESLEEFNDVVGILNTLKEPKSI